MAKPYILVMDQGLDRKRCCELYDPVTDCWYEVESIKNPKVDFSVVSLNNRVYAIGGYDRVIIYHEVNAKSNVECYNPETNVVNSLAPMTCKRSFFGSCALDGKIFALGGHVKCGYFSDVESYDPVVDRWLPCPSMSTIRYSFSCVSLNGSLFAIGGDGHCHKLSSVERLDPREGKWTLVAPMSTARSSTAAIAFNDRVYVTGGIDGSNGCEVSGFITGSMNGSSTLRTCEVFDPRANRWQSIEPMSTRRRCHSIVEVNGKFHVLGGNSRSHFLNKVEVYDPPTNRWTSGKPMNHRHHGSVADIIQCSDEQFENIITPQ